MKKRSMEKRGELMDEDYRLCPEALPEGMIDYIRREVLPKDRVIIYKRGNVNGICTVCGTQVRAMADDLRRVQGLTVRTAVQGFLAFWRTAARLPQIT